MFLQLVKLTITKLKLDHLRITGFSHAELKYRQFSAMSDPETYKESMNIQSTCHMKHLFEQCRCDPFRTQTFQYTSNAHRADNNNVMKTFGEFAAEREFALGRRHWFGSSIPHWFSTNGRIRRLSLFSSQFASNINWMLLR